MVLRYAALNTQIPELAGTSFAHGITTTGLAGSPGAVPTEWKFNNRIAAPSTGAHLYLVSVDTTQLTVASSSADMSGDVFAALNHSIMR